MSLIDTTSEVKWFLQLNGRIQGPLNNEDLQTVLQNIGEENASQALVWKRGLNEWIKANKWKAFDKAPVKVSAKASTKTPVKPDDKTQAIESFENTVFENTIFEKTFAHNYNEGNFYRVQLNFIDQPPMTKAELMDFVAKQEDVSKIAIQDPATKEWREVYTFPDIVEKLGLSRRKQSRVPILAQFTGKSHSNENLSCTVITISQGGMGFTENYELKIGDEIEGQISSPHFFQPVHVKADVIYAGQDGYVGLEFSQIADESKSVIIDYIKKFSKDSGNFS